MSEASASLSGFRAPSIRSTGSLLMMRGLLGRVLRPLIILEMKATVLGDPDHASWQDVRALTDEVEVEEELFGGYFICRGRKRLRRR